MQCLKQGKEMEVYSMLMSLPSELLPLEVLQEARHHGGFAIFCCGVDLGMKDPQIVSLLEYRNSANFNWKKLHCSFH